MITNFLIWGTSLAVATAALAIPLVNGGVMTLTNTATALSINGGSGSQKVQRLTVRIIPGQYCKVYVGALGHNRGTLAGVYAILFPNSAGGHSEQFSIEDPRGTDGIDVSTIAVSSDCTGEQVNYFYFQTGTLPSSTFRIFQGGPVTPSPAAYATLWGGSTTLAALVRVQVVPGASGKLRLKGQTMTEIAQLYPNSGNTYQNNAHSEALQIADKNSGLRPDLMYLTADVAGEGGLVLCATYF